MQTPILFRSIIVLLPFSIFTLVAQQRPTSDIEITRSSATNDTIYVIENQIDGTFDSLEKIPVNELINQRKAKFVHYGIVAQYNPEFEKKYGVIIQNEGCSVSLNAKAVVRNNQRIVAYLNKKYGNAWKKDLGFVPFGTE